MGLFGAGSSLTMALVSWSSFCYYHISWLTFVTIAWTTIVLFLGGCWLGQSITRPLKNLREEFSSIRMPNQPNRELALSDMRDFQELFDAWAATKEHIFRIFSSQRDFTANAAHELKTPLATLRIIGETALRNLTGEESLRDTIGAMLEETHRVTKVVEKLLLLARAESGRLPVEADYHKAADVIGEIVEMLGPLAEMKKQILIPAISENLTLWTDVNLLRLVIENLLSNAIQYSPEGTLILLRATASQSGIVAIEVVDEGPSICREEEERLFERFFRSKNTVAKGSGLGLPIARWAAEAFGGRVEFERRLEKGSVFRVLCPETEWDHIPDLINTDKVEEPSWQGIDLSWAARVQPAQLLARLGTSRTGLLPEESERRRDAIGKNIWSSLPPRHLWHSLCTPFNAILGAAAILSLVLDQPHSAIVISAMILLGTILRFYQERRSYLAAESLQRMVSTEADVLRPGASGKSPISVEDLVPGDVLHLSAGDMVPADLRLLSASELQISEATLTGDSFPVHKEARIAEADSAPSLCYRGTHVVSGTGIGVVIATGSFTKLGKLSKNLRRNRPKNAFDHSVERVGWMLMGFIAVIGPLVFLLNGVVKNDWPGALLFSLAVVVGLTPEFLPVIVNVNLARAALALARRGLVIKELSAVHALGAINILCTDKTGTLTLDVPQFVRTVMPLSNEESNEIFSGAWLNAMFQGSLRSNLDRELLRIGQSAAFEAKAKAFQFLGEIPFDYERRRVSVILSTETGKAILFCKGAPEAVLTACSHYMTAEGVRLLSESNRTAIQKHLLTIQHGGMRILGVARRELAAKAYRMFPQEEMGMVFLGFILFRDPFKEGSRQTIDRLHKAGVELKVLTGGHPESTLKVLREAGMESSALLLGEQMNHMSDEALHILAPQTTVFARLSPLQKARVIRALRSAGYCVGFLGDGANDANALREADVSIASSTSADLARECAQVILLEKNPEILLMGIDQGRTATGNILKYIKCTFSSNFGNVFTILGASIFLPFLPMRAIQLLVQNLLYDLAQIFLPWDHVDKNFRAEPRKWSPTSISIFMLVFGPLSSVFDLITFCVLWFVYGANSPKQAAFFQTGWFIVGLSTQLFVIHILRTEKVPFFKSWASAPFLIATGFVLLISLILPGTPLGTLLGFVHLPWTYYVWAGGIVTIYLLTTQVAKVLYHRWMKARK